MRNPSLGNESVGELNDGISGQVQALYSAHSEPKTPPLLATNRTRRPDILSKFKIYEGGWNISSNHYWASVGFSGAAYFIISILWFMLFGIALVLHRFLDGR